MYNSMFGAGQGSAAFAYDMMVMDDIEKQKEASQKPDVNHVTPKNANATAFTPRKVGKKY